MLDSGWLFSLYRAEELLLVIDTGAVKVLEVKGL